MPDDWVVSGEKWFSDPFRITPGFIFKFLLMLCNTTNILKI